MLSNWFKPKKAKGPIVIDGTSYKVNYKFLHEELCHDVLELRARVEALSTQEIDMLEQIAKLEAENSRLGNAMFDIINQETSGANATVKRMVAIAKTALFS